MRRTRITLGYDGTEFFGSQTQAGVRTVQSELQRAIGRVAPGSTQCVLAGRTDRGVHARGQTASFDARWDRSAGELRTALDAVSPPDIVIRSVDWVAPDFHARFDARWREYRYRFVFGPEPPVHDARFVWWRRAPIDDDIAADAAQRFVGEHSFGAFAGHGWSRSHSRAELVRTVRRCGWRRFDAWDDAGRRVTAEFHITADGFMPQMVRNMVSAVVAVGSGKRPVKWIDHLIASGDRRDLGEAAPPHGLTLWRVTYEVQVDVSARSRSHGECEEN